jgi:hypothetical protein
MTQLKEALAFAMLMAPGAKIAPNDSAYVDSNVPWFLDMAADNVGIKSAKLGTITGDLGVAALSHGTGKYSVAFQMSDLDTTGYTTFPPKDSVYKWKVVVTYHTRVFNDNGTGAQGDVSAADRDFASVKIWTAETLGGTEVLSNVQVTSLGSALTTTGDEYITVAGEIGVEINSSAASSSAAQWVHVDWCFGNVTTAGAVGCTAANFDVSNVRVIGVPDVNEVDYAQITYRDSEGIKAIKRSDTYMDYLGKLTINPNDDPNFSVPAMFMRRFGSQSQLIGQMVSAIKNYSNLYHDAGNRIDDKYNRLGCTSGIEDMVGTLHLFDSSHAPFGDTLSTSVTDVEDQTYLFATFVMDLKLFLDNVERDDRIANIVNKYLAFSSSSNVHYVG